MRWSVVNRCRIEFGEVSCTECRGQENEFKSIPTAKMETRHPVQGYFCSEFQAICNQCGVIAAWRRKMFFFGKNDPLQYNFTNSVRKVFIVSPTDVLCSNFVNIDRQEIGEIVHYLHDKKKSPGSLAVATAWITPKICQGQPQQCTQSAPDFNQIGSLLAEL